MARAKTGSKTGSKTVPKTASKALSNTAAKRAAARSADEYTVEGDRSLEITRAQSRFTDWMYDEVRPYVRGHVLEVGSGIGTYSAYIARQDRKAVFSEIDRSYVARLAKRFPRNDVFLLDISDQKHIAAVRRRHRFDTIIFLNVLEHVKDDRRALRLLRTLLVPGGRIICLVPTHKFLYNSIDRSIHHYRRYTKDELSSKVAGAGFKVERMFSFNFFAIFGWWVNGNLLKRSMVGGGALRLFNALVPVFRLFERWVLRRSVGISTIIVARDPRDAVPARKRRT